MNIIITAIKGRIRSIFSFLSTNISSITLLINSGRAGVLKATIALHTNAIDR